MLWMSCLLKIKKVGTVENHSLAANLHGSELYFTTSYHNTINEVQQAGLLLFPIN